MVPSLSSDKLAAATVRFPALPVLPGCALVKSPLTNGSVLPDPSIVSRPATLIERLPPLPAPKTALPICPLPVSDSVPALIVTSPTLPVLPSSPSAPIPVMAPSWNPEALLWSIDS